MRVLSLITLASALACETFAARWPQFRGPQASGLDASAPVPVRWNADGDITPRDPGSTNAAIVWAHPRQGNYMQTPILVGGLLYGCHDNGVLTCFDSSTGTVRYSERLGSGAEGFTSSPVSDGRNLFFASEPGRVYVVPANGTFSILQTNVLGEICMATPALSAGTLFYRLRSHLIAVGAKETSP